jgi:hypothetical protein
MEEAMGQPRRLNFAVIGCGMIARTQRIPNLAASPKAVLYTCCDLSDEALAECRDQYGALHVTRDYRATTRDPEVDAVTWWDFSDRQAWQGAPAGLLRSDMSPKPLAEWLREAFGERWTTRAVLRSDETGAAQFRGLFGTYAVQAATANGLSLTGSCAFPRRGEREADVRLD